MKRIRIILSVAILLGTLSGCGNQKATSNDGKTDNTTTVTESATDADTKDVSKTSDTIEKNTKDENKKNNNEIKNIVESKDSTEKSSDSSKTKTSTSDNSVKEKVIDYIINGQVNKPDAQKLKWSKAFLNKVDIDAVYKQYTVDGGKADDIENFANYLTQNAPTLDDWQELFKKDLYDAYKEKVVKIEHLKDDSYQVYIEKDGSQVPYVVVSAQTGYFHG